MIGQGAVRVNVGDPDLLAISIQIPALLHLDC
jgi:hypothetical protein